MMLDKVIIVGAGQAGARAALAVRECAPEAAITLFGDERHAPYERPELSKSLLFDPESRIPYVVDPAEFASRGIALHVECPVTAIDRAARTVTLADGRIQAYDRLLLATGSRLKRLTIEGVAPDAILYLRTLDECRALEARLGAAPAVAVIGGGFIGLEVASTAARRGCRVTVIEAAPRLLPRLGCPEASDIVAAHHRRAGLDIRLGVGVVRGEGDELVLSDGSRVPAAVIVAGIGVVAETALAEAAGLEVSDGIVVDANGRTSDPAIYAAGDVTQQFHAGLGRSLRLESWQNANDQAMAAGASLAGCPRSSDAQPWLWSDQGDLNVQTIGAPEAADRVIRRGDPEGDDGVSLFRIAGDRLVGGVTINRGGDMAVMRRLVEAGALALPLDSLADVDIPLRKFLPSRRGA